MSRHPGGLVRCASATYAGRFVVSVYGRSFWDDWDIWEVTVGGNARQRRLRRRELRRKGFHVNVGGVAS